MRQKKDKERLSAISFVSARPVHPGVVREEHSTRETQEQTSRLKKERNQDGKRRCSMREEKPKHYTCGDT